MRLFFPVLILGLCTALVPAQDKSTKKETKTEPPPAILGKTATEWATQLGDGDARLRRSAAFALGRLGSKAVDKLPDMKAALVREKDAKVRDALVFAMAEIGRLNPTADAGLEGIFVNAVGDSDVYVRRSGAFGL